MWSPVSAPPTSFWEKWTASFTDPYATVATTRHEVSGARRTLSGEALGADSNDALRTGRTRLARRRDPAGNRQAPGSQSHPGRRNARLLLDAHSQADGAQSHSDLHQCFLHVARRQRAAETRPVPARHLTQGSFR